MARKMKVDLGCKVRDTITGFSGIATSRHIDFTGAVQIGIQPPLDKKKPSECPEAISVDEVQVEWVAMGQRKLTRPPPQTFSFELGDEVRDKMSGYTGIAIRLGVWMNGCVNVAVRGKVKEGDVPDKTYNCFYQAIERVGPGLNATTAAAAPKTKGPSGGASQRVERA